MTVDWLAHWLTGSLSPCISFLFKINVDTLKCFTAYFCAMVLGIYQEFSEYFEMMGIYLLFLQYRVISKMLTSSIYNKKYLITKRLLQIRNTVNVFTRIYNLFLLKMLF